MNGSIHKLKQMVADKAWLKIKTYLSRLHASEAAELLKEVQPEARPIIFRSLPRKFATKIFSYFGPDEQDDLLQSLNKEETKRLLADLPPDDRTELFEELPAEATKRIFALLSPEDLKKTRDLLGYPPESVGRVMTPDYIAIKPDWTAVECLDYVRQVAKKSETADLLYVIDDKGRLINEVKLHNLILAAPDAKVKDLEEHHRLIKMSAHDDQEKAVHAIRKYNRVALPVVDAENVLLGIVTVDDLMDVAEEEATEDFHKIAAVSSRRGDATMAKNILDAPLAFLYERRIWWLFILIFVNVFSGAIIANFEDLISRMVKLVFFLPLLIGSGGNAGSQAATLMVRALGTGDVKVGDWLKVISRELFISGLLGVTMGVGVGLLGFLRGGWELVVIVSLSMMSIVIFGSLIGTILPFIFTKLKKDPATASGPLVASIADILGVFIYFTIASLFIV